MKNIIFASTALFCSLTAIASSVSCYENPITNARQCFDPKRVYEKDGIRSTALYTGGPNGIEKTNFTLNVNCATQVVHLKDRQGVSFAGGSGSETKAIISLRNWVCEANPVGAKTKK